MKSSPSSAMNPSDGHIKIAATGSDNSLWVRDLDTGSMTGGWIGLSGLIISNPYIIYDAQGRMHVLVIGSDHALWDNAGSIWRYLGGYITSDAKPILDPANSNGVLTFVRGGDGSLWKNSFDASAGSNQWTALGGYILPATGDIYRGNPEPVSSQDGSIYALVVGGDRSLWELTVTGTGNLGWSNLGSSITSNPSSSWPLTAARGADNALQTLALSGQAISNSQTPPIIKVE